MAADSSVWSSSQGSEIRLPGGGDAELGVEQQQLKGGGGAEIHASSSPFEEWYDASLIDEMKELSSYPAQQQRHHHQHHHHQMRNSASSPAFAAADRRGFSSTFLDVDESGFMGDFATATAGGLLPPPPPPPLLPPPPPPRHRFGGGDIGLLDFGAAGGAAAWAGPNFGIGTSLSIGTMSGTVFSSKTTQQQQQQHTGSGHSSPSTIIKSPTSAFASADSSLEIGGGGGGGDVEVAAVAARTGRRRRKGGGGGGGSSSSPPAAGEEAGLDGREDEDMDDASGLLCETDDIPAPMTGQPGGPGGGKGNRKGLPAKNLMAERRRRKKLNDRLYMLRSVVPRITKMDRASILGDAIEYLKDLLQRINELHNELESPGDGALGPSDQHIPPLPGMMPAPPPLLMPPTCVKEEGGAAGSAGPPPPPPPPSTSEPPKVDVRTRDGKTINIHMFCARRPGLLLSTMRALDGLGLDVQQAVISCFNGFVLDVFRAEQCREGEVAPEDIKSALLQTAGCNNEAMPS